MDFGFIADPLGRGVERCYASTILPRLPAKGRVPRKLRPRVWAEVFDPILTRACKHWWNGWAWAGRQAPLLANDSWRLWAQENLAERMPMASGVCRVSPAVSSGCSAGSWIVSSGRLSPLVGRAFSAKEISMAADHLLYGGDPPFIPARRGVYAFQGPQLGGGDRHPAIYKTDSCRMSGRRSCPCWRLRRALYTGTPRISLISSRRLTPRSQFIPTRRCRSWWR